MKSLLIITMISYHGYSNGTKYEPVVISQFVYECESYKKHLLEIIPQDEVLKEMKISVQCIVPQ